MSDETRFLSSPREKSISRRTLLGGAGSLGVATALSVHGRASASGGSLGHSVRALSQEAKTGGSLRVGMSNDATTMDPHFSGSKYDRMVYFNIYDPLVQLDASLNIVPGLAESWTVSDDQLTYTFKLRQGVTFHDGTDFNADAVKANFDRMMDPEQESLRRGEVAGIEAVTVVDASTIEMTLLQPNAALLATLADRAGMIISPAAIEQYGAELARNPVGTGPFSFVEWLKDDHLSLARFDGYWDTGKPYLDDVTIRVILDDTVRVAALRNGEIDIVDYVQPKFVEELKGDGNLNTVDVPALGVWWLWLNETAAPFDNKALREAFAAAIDIEPIVERIMLGVGRAANGPISPASWAYDESIPYRKRDLDLARAKLAEGGMPDGFACTFKDTPTTVTTPLVQLLQAQVAEVGIEMEIVPVDAATQIADTVAKNFEVTWSQWSGRADPDGNTYNHFFTDAGMNYGGYSNPEVDDLLNQARAGTTQDERKAIYSQITQKLNEDVPVVFIWHPDEPKSNRLKDLPLIPDGMLRFGPAWLE
jgi:peptide/nickel transport system substrate-binding protein